MVANAKTTSAPSIHPRQLWDLNPWNQFRCIFALFSVDLNKTTVKRYAPPKKTIIYIFSYQAPTIDFDGGSYIHVMDDTYNRRKFRSQTSDNMDRWKTEQGRGRERRKIRREKSRRERVRRKKMQTREKVGKWRNTVFFPMICGSGGSKSRLAKAPGAEPAGQMRDEKLHTVVARSTFRSQNVQNTASDHFWKLRCRKSARRCGAKHISKSKCTKHTMVGPLLEVETSKKCTPLWCEAHFEVKMYKAPHVRATFGGSDVEKVHAVVARSTFQSQNVKNTRGLDHFWRFRCRFASPTLHYTTLRYTTLHYTTLSLHYTTLHNTTLQLQLHSTTLHYTKLHYTPLHYTSLHYTTLPSTTLHYITLHYTPLQLQLQLHNYTPLHSTTLNYTTPHYITLHYTHYTTLHYTTVHYLPLHFTTLHYTTLHYSTTTATTTQLHSTTLHYTKLHYTTLHYTTLHSTTLHYTTLHYTKLHYTEWHCATDRQVDR